MHSYKKIVMFAVLSGSIIFGGCMQMQQPVDAVLKPVVGGDEPQPAASPKQFRDAAPEGPTVVESAIELSKKYATLSEEMAKSELEKQNVINENARLKEQLKTVEPELIQAKKELAEANDLLVEMRIELNNWKTDVLGFRDEIREANKVQLETLIKILKVLGGETKDIDQGQDPVAEP